MGELNIGSVVHARMDAFVKGVAVALGSAGVLCMAHGSLPKGLGCLAGAGVAASLTDDVLGCAVAVAMTAGAVATVMRPTRRPAHTPEEHAAEGLALSYYYNFLRPAAVDLNNSAGAVRLERRRGDPLQPAALPENWRFVILVPTTLAGGPGLRAVAGQAVRTGTACPAEPAHKSEPARPLFVHCALADDGSPVVSFDLPTTLDTLDRLPGTSPGCERGLARFVDRVEALLADDAPPGHQRVRLQRFGPGPVSGPDLRRLLGV